MEESEKRRERLRAMRMEAAQVDATGNVDEPALPSYLSNPLIENSATTLSREEECSTARFDFYTDPMAAFSSSKRRSNDIPPRYSGFSTSQIPSNSAGTSDPEYRPPPHFHWDHLQGPSHGCSSAPYGNPVRTPRPFPVNQATSMARQFYQPHPGPTPGSGWAPRPPPLGHSASTGLDRGTTLAWAPRPSHSPIPRSGYPRHPNPSPGRCRGNWSGTHTSPGSGQWVSAHGRGSGFVQSSRVEGFYDESMLEDPWKFLEPILWKNVNCSSKIRDLEMKSLAAKRARASEPWGQSSSQQSLAEYLAASLNEAVDETSIS